jgi:hypothetical protein
MMKSKLLMPILILLFLYTSNSFADKSNLHIFLSAGRSITYSEDNPENISINNKKYYNSANYGINLQWKQHLLDFNYKYFFNNTGSRTCEISDEVTGKEFRVISLHYGRQLYSYNDFFLNAFAGFGYIERVVNHQKAGPSRSTKDEILTLPLKLTISRAINKRFILNASIFSNLNLKEIIGGLEANLQFKIM